MVSADVMAITKWSIEARKKAELRRLPPSALSRPRQPNCRLEEIPGRLPSGAAGVLLEVVSALWGIGERVIRIAGIHKIGTAGAQQSFNRLDGSPDYAAWLASLNLALQLEQAPIGAVETLRQNLAT